MSLKTNDLKFILTNVEKSGVMKVSVNDRGFMPTSRPTLTRQDCEDIRDQYHDKSLEYTHESLGRKFGVGAVTINQVLAHKYTPLEDFLDRQQRGVSARKKKSYRLVRYFVVDREILKTGLSYDEANKHVMNPETSSTTCLERENLEVTKRRGPWFDGYEEEHG